MLCCDVMCFAILSFILLDLISSSAAYIIYISICLTQHRSLNLSSRAPSSLGDAGVVGSRAGTHRHVGPSAPDWAAAATPESSRTVPLARRGPVAPPTNVGRLSGRVFPCSFALARERAAVPMPRSPRSTHAARIIACDGTTDVPRHSWNQRLACAHAPRKWVWKGEGRGTWLGWTQLWRLKRSVLPSWTCGG